MCNINIIANLTNIAITYLYILSKIILCSRLWLTVCHYHIDLSFLFTTHSVQCKTNGANIMTSSTCTIAGASKFDGVVGSPPAGSIFKVNFDGAVFAQQRKSGVGSGNS